MAELRTSNKVRVVIFSKEIAKADVPFNSNWFACAEVHGPNLAARVREGRKEAERLNKQVTDWASPGYQYEYKAAKVEFL
jgi:hypothetical protein